MSKIWLVCPQKIFQVEVYWVDINPNQNPRTDFFSWVVL